MKITNELGKEIQVEVRKGTSVLPDFPSVQLAVISIASADSDCTMEVTAVEASAIRKALEEAGY